MIATNCWGDELTMLFELGVGGFVCVPLSDGVPGVRGVDGCVDPDELCRKLCTCSFFRITFIDIHVCIY